MENKNTISIKSLSIGYIEKKVKKIVIEGITADILSSELTCLIGANGVGKSTLLRTLSGFQDKISGEITIDGKDLSEYTIKEMSQKIAVVLTDKFDIRGMSSYELIGLGRSPYTGFFGSLNDADRKVVDEAIEMVGIERLRDRMVDSLSDGERQKVMIAKALAQQTPIIFLDEPTAFLDYPSKVEIMQLLSRLAHELKKTIFLSTHDLDLALQLSDRLWLIDKNRGVETGTPKELSYGGQLERLFGSDLIYFDRQAGLFKCCK